MDGSARGRGEQPKDPAGDDFLLQDCVAENLAATITARGMACLCLASPQLRRSVPGLVRLAMEARHGLWIADNATRDLHFLDKTPTTLSLDFRQRDAVRVEQGSALCSTMVGGEEDLITLAQLPPRRGDAKLPPQRDAPKRDVGTFGTSHPPAYPQSRNQVNPALTRLLDAVT